LGRETGELVRVKRLLSRALEGKAWLFLLGFSTLVLIGCGSATDKVATATVALNGGALTTSSPTPSVGLSYDPATRFKAWGSADPALKATPNLARECAVGTGGVDQIYGGFKIYANNCVMSYQVSQARFDQMLSAGDFFASDLLEKFSQTFKDDFDFIVLSLDTGSSQPAANFPYFGQYQSLGTRLPTRLRRLMGHIQLPFGIEPIASGPFLHEIFHEWGQRNALPDMGVDEGHWGHVSTQGQLGGFDASTLVKTGSRVDGTGQTVYSYQAAIRPLQAAPGTTNPEFCTNFTRSYGTVANGGNSVPLGPFELFMMGLVAPEQVQPLIRLRNAVSKGDIFSGPTGPGNAKSLVSLIEASGEARIDLATVRQRLAAADPVIQPKQNNFRAAYITVTSKESLDASAVDARRIEALEMAQQSHPQSNLYLGCVARYNLYTATQGLASIAFGGLREARR
jgi:hypothetical protein